MQRRAFLRTPQALRLMQPARRHYRRWRRKLHYLSDITALYALHPAQRLWADEHAVVQLQQQLVEVALSGVQPQFTQWVT